MSLYKIERRRKEPVGLNPCGNWWKNDDNKFGQRMLEKTGWTKGKGLGIKEQGITEPISILHKSDKAGLGYNENAINEAFESNYNKMLENLSNIGNFNSDKCNSVNLTKQRSSSQNVKQSSDMKYTSKDLADIFGHKIWIYEDQSKVKEVDAICTEETIGTKNKNNGVITINGGSMVDYFNRKMNRFSKKQCFFEK